jgi:hypothetical protein
VEGEEVEKVVVVEVSSFGHIEKDIEVEKWDISIA